MYDTIEGGGGGQPRRRGTRLAPELDRRLAGDEFLGDIIGWWSDTWRASAELYMTFTYGDEAIRVAFSRTTFTISPTMNSRAS
jgi:hypothetical protein